MATPIRKYPHIAIAGTPKRRSLAPAPKTDTVAGYYPPPLQYNPLARMKRVLSGGYSDALNSLSH